LGVTSP